MLTDSFLENQGGLIPIVHICQALGQICIPLAGRRIAELLNNRDEAETQDEDMIELELCIGLIFKPLRHHVQNIVNEGTHALMTLWKPTLDVLKIVFNEPISVDSTAENGADDTKYKFQPFNELALEHLRNVIMVLINYDVIHAAPHEDGDITSLTWSAVAEMECCKKFLEEWKQAASKE